MEVVSPPCVSHIHMTSGSRVKQFLFGSHRAEWPFDRSFLNSTHSSRMIIYRYNYVGPQGNPERILYQDLPRPRGSCRLTWTGVCYRDLAGLVALPGQACVLHEVLPELEPGHWLPPCCGAGLSQERVRDLLPLPQVRLHVPHAAQEPRAPSTETQRRAQLAIFTPSRLSTHVGNKTSPSLFRCILLCSSADFLGTEASLHDYGAL